MTLLFEKTFQNGNGKGVGGLRCAVKLVKPLINECLNERIVHYSNKLNTKNKPKNNKISKSKSNSKSISKSKSESKSKTKKNQAHKKIIKNQKNRNKKKKDYLD